MSGVSSTVGNVISENVIRFRVIISSDIPRFDVSYLGLAASAPAVEADVSQPVEVRGCLCSKPLSLFSIRVTVNSNTLFFSWKLIGEFYIGFHSLWLILIALLVC